MIKDFIKLKEFKELIHNKKSKDYKMCLIELNLLPLLAMSESEDFGAN